MATLEAIRDGIRSTLENGIDGLRCYDTVPEAVEPPAIVVSPATARFDVAFGRGTDTWMFDLSLLVSWGDSDVAQDSLDAYVTGAGARSVRQVIFANRTLGLEGTDAHVSELTQYGTGFSFANVNHLGAVLRLVVHTRGTE